MDAHVRELRYFVAVADELNVTRAARRLYVSQPAVSKQIRSLERRLGRELFTRRAEGMGLTAAGEALLPAARAVIAQWDAGVARARAAGDTGTLVVAQQTAVGRDLQRRPLARFREHAPGWTVSLRLAPWGDSTCGLGDGTADVAFAWLPVPHPGIRTRVLVRERRWVALPNGHHLAGREVVAFTELLHEPFVALPEEAGAVREFWLGTAERDGVPPVIGATAHAADEAFEAVAAGLGAVLIAEGNAGLYARPGVVCRPVAGLAPAELALAWRADDRRPVVAAFVAAYGWAGTGQPQ
ncbi:LysR family transcriptional regulator [Streptomyces capparidis]